MALLLIGMLGGRTLAAGINPADRQALMQELQLLRQEATALGALQTGDYATAAREARACMEAARRGPYLDRAAPGSWQESLNATVRTISVKAGGILVEALSSAGQFEDALKAGRDVLSRLDPERDAVIAADVHRGLAMAYAGLLQYEKAAREVASTLTGLDPFVKTLDGVRPLLAKGDASSASILVGLAENARELRSGCHQAFGLLQKMGRWEDVIREYQSPSYRALDAFLNDPRVARLEPQPIFTQLNDAAAFREANDEAVCWGSIASETQDDATLRRALAGYQQAESVLKRDPAIDPEGQGRVALESNLGVAYEDLHQPEQALASLQAALQVSEKMPAALRRDYGLQPLVNLAGVMLDQKPPRVAEAAKYVDAADALAAGRPADEEQWRLANVRGRVHEAQGSLTAALSAYREAVRIIERERAGLLSPELKETFFRDRQNVYENLLRVLHKLGRDNEAFTDMEEIRARNLLDVMSGVRIVKGLPPRLVRASDRLRADERSLQIARNRLAAAKGHPVERGLLPSQVARQMENVRQESSSVLEQLARKAPELADMRGAKPLPAGRLASLLDRDTVVLEYFVGPDFGAVCVLDHTGRPRVVPLPVPMPALQRVLRDFQPWNRMRPGRAPAARLYQALLSPVESAVRAHRRLVIVPFARLNYVPWAALVKPGTKHVLAESHAVVVLPSTNVLRFCRAKENHPGRRMLACALGNVAVGGYSPLPGTLAEVKDVTRFYPRPTVLKGARFTREAVAADAPRMELLHFATHGILDMRHPLRSGILTADGELRVSDIVNLPLKARLVVLSACQTGRGKIYEGDELVGLTRAFMYAGTPSLVATLWNVDDRATARLMNLFYQGLSRGLDKAEALRKAQLALRKANPDPALWAPFVLIGDWK